MLKTIIVLLLIGILASLAAGFVFFYKDKGRSKRVLYALGVRVTLAVVMIVCIFFRPCYRRTYAAGTVAATLTIRSVFFGKEVSIWQAGRVIAASVLERSTLLYSTYTKMNKPTQTTSTKCQYHEAASNPKWSSGLK